MTNISPDIVPSGLARLLRRIFPALPACLAVFFFSGCGSEFEVLLDKDQSLPAVIISAVYGPAPSTVYWSEQTGSIRKAPSRGAGDITLLSTTGTPVDIALDLPGQRIYWAEADDGFATINNSRLDGTEPAVFAFDVPAAGDHGFYEIAIDPAAAIIYYSRYQSITGHNDIWRSPLSGFSQEKWINELSYPYTYSMALDTVNRKIYVSANTYWDMTTAYGSGQAGGLYIAELDTMNTYLPYQVTASGPAAPSVPIRDIAVDGAGGRLYYASNTAAGLFIIRAGLLFEDPAVWITAGGFDIQKLALDLTERKIYWTSYSPNGIYRADIEQPETGIEMFRSLSGRPTGIAVSH